MTGPTEALEAWQTRLTIAGATISGLRISPDECRDLRNLLQSASAPWDARDDVIELIYEFVGAPKDAPYGDLPGYVRDALLSASAHRATAEKCKQIVIEEGPRAYPNIDRIVKRIDQLATALPEAPQPRHLVRRGLRPDGTYPPADDDEAPQSETQPSGTATMRDALGLAIMYLKGDQLAHVWANYPEKPERTLLQVLEDAYTAPSPDGNEELK